MRSHSVLRSRYVPCIFIMSLSFANLARATQPVSGISFSQIRYGGTEYSRLAQVRVAASALYGSGYLNVERYEQGTAVDWAVRNLPVNGDIATAMFDLGTSGQQHQVTAYVEFSPEPLYDDSSLKNQLPFVYMLSLVELPPDNNPNQFQDVACYKDDKKFWAGQASVVVVQVLLDSKRLVTKDGSGWIVKGKDPNKTFLITASHNFTDDQASETGIYVNLQRKNCGSGREGSWFENIDQVLERNQKLDFVVVSLKPAPTGKQYPPPLQPLYEEIKPGLVVSLPQHPAGYTLYKQGGSTMTSKTRSAAKL